VKNKLRAVGAAVAAGVLAVALGSTGTAYADPSGPPTFRDLAGVGSDTTQGVMNAISDVVVSPGGPGFPAAGTKLIASYDAVGPSPVVTKDPAVLPNCSFNPRPNGSTQGRQAFDATLTPGSATAGCLQFARSSSGVATTTNPMTWVPFAVDAVDFAVNKISNLPKQLAKNDLVAIYNCTIPGVNAYIPQAGSGTRNFFLTFLGINPGGPFGSCVKETKNGAPIEEHDGRVVNGDPNGIVPISIAQNIAQGAGTLPDIRGDSILGAMDSNLTDPTNVPANDVAPFVINSGTAQTASPATGWPAPMQREVFNIVATAQLGNVEIANVFVGSSSQVCQQSLIIKAFGFQTDPNCGSTTLHN